MNEVLRLARLRHGKKGCGHYRYAERKSVIVCRGCGERFEGDRAATRALQHIRIDRPPPFNHPDRDQEHADMVKESIADDRREAWAHRWEALWVVHSSDGTHFPRRRSLHDGLFAGGMLVLFGLFIVRWIAQVFS